MTSCRITSIFEDLILILILSCSHGPTVNLGLIGGKLSPVDIAIYASFRKQIVSCESACNLPPCDQKYMHQLVLLLVGGLMVSAT